MKGIRMETKISVSMAIMAGRAPLCALADVTLRWGQTRLAEVWKEISGHEVVFITKARRSGGKALIHLLKYVSKPPASDPDKIGLLEVAFHGTRRIHALGLFYNFVSEDTDNIHSEWGNCPHCGAEIVKVPGTARIEKAIIEGRTFVGTKNTERRKSWLN
jgi:hypothetical protein